VQPPPPHPVIVVREELAEDVSHDAVVLVTAQQVQAAARCLPVSSKLPHQRPQLLATPLPAAAVGGDRGGAAAVLAVLTAAAAGVCCGRGGCDILVVGGCVEVGVGEVAVVVAGIMTHTWWREDEEGGGDGEEGAEQDVGVW